MCDQAIAHGEQRVGACSVGEAQSLLGDANHHAADDIDKHHQQARDGVAAHEFGGAVHGAEKA